MFGIEARRAAVRIGLFLAVAAALGCEDAGPREIWSLTKIKGADLEYAPTIPKADVERLGEYLSKSGFLDGSPKSLRLAPSGEGFEMRLPIMEELAAEPGYLEVCKLLCVELSVKVFADKPCSLRLCDTSWKSLAIVTQGGLKGKSFAAGTLAYGPGIPRESIDKLGKYLVDHAFFTDDAAKVMRIERNGDAYEFLMIKADGVELTPELQASFRYLSLELSVEAFDFAPVTVRLCGDGWKNEATFVELDHGPGLRFAGGVVFRGAGVDEAVAKQLGDYLVAEKFFTTGLKPVRVTKRGDVFEFRFVAGPEKVKDEAFHAIAKDFGAELSQGAFGGAATEVHLCDQDFKTLKAIPQAKK